MFALATVEAAVFNIAYLVGIPTPEHLVDEAIIGARMVTRIDACEPVPVLDKDLFEDVPVLCRSCHHQGAPSGGNGMVAVQLFYHTSPVLSTLSSAFSGAHPPPLFPLSHGDARTAEKCKFLCDELIGTQTDGMFFEAVLAHLLQVFLGHHEPGGRRGRPVEGHEVGPGGVQMETHGQRIDDLDALDLRMQLRGPAALVALEAKLHVFGGAGIAVVEL